MAGGLIPTKNLELLGEYPEDRIIHLFLEELEAILQDTIRQTASVMYSGCADRTPSENACMYCRMKHSCGVSIT